MSWSAERSVCEPVRRFEAGRLCFSGGDSLCAIFAFARCLTGRKMVYYSFNEEIRG